MRFAFDPYMVSVDLDEGATCILQIENKRAYTSILSDLYMLINYGEGDAALYDEEESIDLKKNADIIFEPFSLDLNNKRIKTQLYQLIVKKVNDCFYQQYVDVCDEIQKLIGMVTEDVPYFMTFDCKYSIEDILKLCNVLMDYPCDSVAERINAYIKLMADACKIKIFFLVDIAKYVSQEELNEIIKLAKYNKINFIIICSDRIITAEQIDTYILDESLCFLKACNA